MKLQNLSWHFLTRNTKASLTAFLRGCAALLAVFALLAYGAHVRDRRSALQEQQIEVQLMSARARLRDTDEKVKTVRTYIDRYQDLRQNGVLVPVDRAVNGDWFDAAITALRGGAVDSYVIGREQAFTGGELTGLTAYRVVSRRLDFKAAVRHEDEFAELMSTLAAKLPGIATFEGCALTLDTRNDASVHGLAASCGIVWYEYYKSDSDVASVAVPPALTPVPRS
jgi:hypothetical protein